MTALATRPTTCVRALDFPDAAAEIVDTARHCHARGWLPATAGNISMRVDDDLLLITPSGMDKARLHPAALVPVVITTAQAVPGGTARPSAETSIHAAVYRAGAASAVVHAHPVAATTLATVLGTRRQVCDATFTGFELLKVLTPGHTDGPLTVPILPNHADVARIAATTYERLAANVRHPPALLIEGHGATVWGTGADEASTRLEALDGVCDLALRVGAALGPLTRPVLELSRKDAGR